MVPLKSIITTLLWVLHFYLVIGNMEHECCAIPLLDPLLCSDRVVVW